MDGALNLLILENLQYETSKKSLNLLPAVYPNEKCSAGSLSRDAQKVSILGKQEFEEAYPHSCKFRRLMSFVCFPFLTRVGDKRYLAGDLRYAFPTRGNFTVTQIDDVQSGTPCGWNSVPWDSPFITSPARPR